MKNRNVLGIDLAKNVIQICKISSEGELIYNKAVSPNKLRQLLGTEKISIVAMEGCGSCHYWSRLSEQYGHDTRVIAPKKVKAFLQGHKTDANDAVAIAIAATQFGMIFSQIKSEEQQSLQTLEVSRKLLSNDVTALGNHIRSYMYEYGITSNKGKKGLRESVATTLDIEDKRLPVSLKGTLRLLWGRYKQTTEQLKQTEKEKAALVKQLEPCKRLLDLEGVGVVCASLLYASIGNGKNFKKTLTFHRNTGELTLIHYTKPEFIWSLKCKAFKEDLK